MATCKHGGFVYVKDNVHGTIFLTIDNENPVAVNFFHSIKIKITLGVIRPSCEIKGLLPKGRQKQLLNQKAKSFDVDVSGGDVSNKNKSKHPLEDIATNSDIEEEPHDDGDIIPVNETVKDIERPCKDTRTVSPVELELHTNSTGTCRNVSVHQNSHNSKKSLTLQTQNIGEKCHLYDTETGKQLKHRKQKLCIKGEIRLNRKQYKKGAISKNVNGKLTKVLEINPNKEPEEEIVTKDEIKAKEKQDQLPKEKRSAKWKLAHQISCQYCLKVFENQQAYYDHKKTTRSQVFDCSKCSKVFPFLAHLQAHIKAYHKDGKKFSNLKESASCICDVCGSEVKNMFALKKHLMFHTQEYFYRCCICGKQFVEPGTLNNHMITHKSGGMIRCKCCDQLFATRGALAKHKLASVEVKCHLCDQVFPNKTSRTQHYKVFHQNDILTCSKCTSMFSSQGELAVHMKKHNLYKKKQCKICGKLFSRLEKHIVTHKARAEIDESQLFVCDKCPKKFTNRSSFQRHLTIHSQDKPYQCPSCPRRFADCGVLRKHLRRHLSLMPYECEVCGKKCKEPGNLKVHMRIHSDTKQFQCQICPQAFNYKSSLEGHMRSRHSQILNADTLLPQALEQRQDYVPLSCQIFTSTRTDPGPNQTCEGASWKLDLDHNHPPPHIPNPDLKEYFENRPTMCIKPLYDGNGFHSVNMISRHSYQVHPAHVNPLNLNATSKQSYEHDSTSVANKTTYIENSPSVPSKLSYLHDPANVGSKPTYIQGAANIPPDNTYLEPQVDVGNTNLISSFPRESSSTINDLNTVSVSSMDMTSLNVSSMNVSLY